MFCMGFQDAYLERTAKKLATKRGVVIEAGIVKRRWPAPPRPRAGALNRIPAHGPGRDGRGRGLFGIRVTGYHSNDRPAKYAFSARLLARFWTCKINRLCAWLCRTIFGHLLS